ncbi:MAG TPA: signal peptidase II, partial [Longimicrobiaceae bacterium]|nr:signal peptidase II [Longimicrobiaceae bacterium]
LNRPHVRRRSDREPRYGWLPALAITLLVAALDWSTKVIVVVTVPVGHMVEVSEDRVALWHVKNPDMVLGLWGNLPIESRMVIAVVALILSLLLLYEILDQGHRLPVHRRPWAWLFVGLAAGGIVGNLGERLIYWHVTDFLSLRWGSIWLPPANFADLAFFLAIPAAVPVMIFELQARASRNTRPALHQPQTGSDSPALALEIDLRSRLAGGDGR